MNNLLKSLRMQKTGRLNTDGFRNLQADVTRRVDEVTIAMTTEVRLVLEVGVIFRYRQGEQVPSLDNAYRQMREFIYGDIIEALYQIEGAVFDGDAKEALSRVQALRSELLRRPEAFE